MAWLARDKETDNLDGAYVFSFGTLDYVNDELGWLPTCSGKKNFVCTFATCYQGPHLEPGEGSIKVKLVKDED